IKVNKLPLNSLYQMGYQRVGCWACLQDMLHKDSRLFTLRQHHPKMYEILRKKFGKQMINLLTAWAGLNNRDFQEEQLDELYKPCLFI
ncbi:MAG: hypothetical protein QXF61_11500, partial [Nitrososphaeria archaeon]